MVEKTARLTIIWDNDGWLILKVGAHTWQIHHHGNVEALEKTLWADPRKLKQLGSMNGAGCH